MDTIQQMYHCLSSITKEMAATICQNCMGIPKRTKSPKRYEPGVKTSRLVWYLRWVARPL